MWEKLSETNSKTEDAILEEIARVFVLIAQDMNPEKPDGISGKE